MEIINDFFLKLLLNYQKTPYFFNLSEKKSFLNWTLGLEKYFLNQTTYALKNRLQQLSFLNQDSFLNQAFLNRDSTVLVFKSSTEQVKPATFIGGIRVSVQGVKSLGSHFTCSIIFRVKSLQKEQNSTNLLQSNLVIRNVLIRN